MQCSRSQKINVYVLITAIAFLMGIGIDLYVPSLPDITQYFHTHSSLVQFTVSLYMLGYGIGQFIFGILCDTIGRRKILISSAICYTLVALLSAFSPNIYVLIILRLFQGICIAGMGIVVRTLASDCFSGVELAKAYAYLSASWALGPVLGPYIGSYLQHYFNWQANFYFFAIYGLAVLIYAGIRLPESKKALLPLKVKEIKHSFKIIITSWPFVFSMILPGLAYAILVIFNIIGPFLIQIRLHYSVIFYGHLALFLGLGYLIGNIMNRFLLHYFEPLQIVLAAVLLSILDVVIMLILGLVLSINIYIIVIPTFIIFALAALILPTMAATSLGLFSDRAGIANAVYGITSAGAIFIMTSLATMLKTTSQIPMTLMYLGLTILYLVFFISYKISTKKQ